jgi:excisionase family DNA binding protein
MPYTQEVQLTEYLNVPQVARMLKVNIQTVRAYIRSGELSAARIGRRYVLTPEDVDTFIRKRKESRRAEDIGLTEKGREHVEKVRANAERVLGYLGDCPGAANAEISEALGIGSEEDTHRALLLLEGRGLAYSEPDTERPDRRKDPWYPRAGC